MKILQIMASCSRGSGVAQVIMQYYRQIHQQVTFDFYLYWDVEDSFKEEIERLGGSVYVVGKPGIREIPAFVRNFDHFLSAHKGEYTAIHLHELFLNFLVFPVAKKHGTVRRIAHSHTTKFSEFPLNAIRNRVAFYWARYLATDFFACSFDAGKMAFGRRICNSAKFAVIKNAIDPVRYRYSETDRQMTRKALGLSDEFVVGHIGRFSPQKNHMFLLTVYDELHKKLNGTKLLMIGDGPLFSEVRKAAQEKRIGEQVIQLGVRTDIGALLSAMDVFVLPSTFEGLGNVLVEAQCNGLPCVASDAIPAEAEVLPSYRKLSLHASAAEWADMVIACRQKRDEEAEKKIDLAGYDIKTASKELLKKYLEMKA